MLYRKKHSSKSHRSRQIGKTSSRVGSISSLPKPGRWGITEIDFVWNNILQAIYFSEISMSTTPFLFKVAGVKVYPRQTWNFRSHAVSACIGLWHHWFMHTCTECIAPWHHRLMHAVIAWALLLWFHLRYTFISSYFGFFLCCNGQGKYSLVAVVVGYANVNAS